MRKGFTLVELSIVIIILGILMSLVVKGKNLIYSAKVHKEFSVLRNIQTMMSVYYANHSRYPKTEGSDMCRFDAVKLFNAPLDDFKSTMYKQTTSFFSDGNLYYTVMRMEYETSGLISPNCSVPFKGNYAYFITTAEKYMNQEKLSGNTLFSRKEMACNIENYLDDRSFTTGLGVIVSNAGSEWTSNVSFDDCERYADVQQNGYALAIDF